MSRRTSNLSLKSKQPDAADEGYFGSNEIVKEATVDEETFFKSQEQLTQVLSAVSLGSKRNAIYLSSPTQAGYKVKPKLRVLKTIQEEELSHRDPLEEDEALLVRKKPKIETSPLRSSHLPGEQAHRSNRPSVVEVTDVRVGSINWDQQEGPFSYVLADEGLQILKLGPPLEAEEMLHLTDLKSISVKDGVCFIESYFGRIYSCSFDRDGELDEFVKFLEKRRAHRWATLFNEELELGVDYYDDEQEYAQGERVVPKQTFGKTYKLGSFIGNGGNSFGNFSNSVP